jgi:hypothetical protein
MLFGQRQTSQINYSSPMVIDAVEGAFFSDESQQIVVVSKQLCMNWRIRLMLFKVTGIP